MTQTSSIIPGFAVRGVASGVLFMAFFGTLWASIGVGGLQGWGGSWLSLIVLLVGIALLLGSISLFFASRRLPNQEADVDASQGRRTGLWFIITFALEGILIGVASGICNALHRFDLFFPVMALIVGVHFFPLAALFHVKLYYLVGTLLCMLAIITLFTVPEHVQLGGQQLTAQWVVLGFGAAFVLWGVGVGLWLLGRRLLALSDSKKQ